MRKKETISLLRRIAARSIREIETQGLGPLVFFNVQTGSKNDKIDEVLSLLVLFISETERVHELLLKGGQWVAHELKRAFIHHIIDAARKQDPFKKLYRNAQAGIRESELFSFPESSKKGFCFWRKGKHSPGKIILTDDDLKEIPFPDNICPGAEYTRVNKKKVLIALADYFLSRVEELFNGCDPIVPLNVFTRWISLYTLLSFQCNPFDDKKTGAFQEDKTEAVSCARAFANRLPEIERQVFFLYHCEELSHDQVKQKLNRNSYPSHQKKRSETMLREFLMPFSWKSGETMFSLFFKKLCQILSREFKTNSFKAV
ncbi:MAG: hypothetical protein PF503_01705 [Desulfobacula sp.]|nr:hypothetical protein [Desulfobacula sp.]